LKIHNLHLVGNLSLPRIPVYSFVIKFNKKLLHYNYVAALLNDLFGIQSRGGCSCASVYGHHLLGITEELSEKLEKVVCNGNEIFRPGYTRINLPYFYEDFINDYVLNAIEFISIHGWKFLTHYAYRIESGEFYNRLTETEKRKWLNQISFKDGEFILPELLENNSRSIRKEDLDKHFDDVIKLTDNIKNISKQFVGKSKFNNNIIFNEFDLRWFLLSDDIEELYDCEDSSDIVNKLMFLNLDNKFDIKFGNEKKEDNNDNSISNNLIVEENLAQIDMENNEFMNVYSEPVSNNIKEIKINLYPEYVFFYIGFPKS